MPSFGCGFDVVVDVVDVVDVDDVVAGGFGEVVGDGDGVVVVVVVVVVFPGVVFLGVVVDPGEEVGSDFLVHPVALSA